MLISNKYFEILKKNNKIMFVNDEHFIAEFIRQCRLRGYKIEKIQKNGFIEIVQKKEYRFYIQKMNFNYKTGKWHWKLYAKAETYEEASKKVGSLYSHCGDKIYRILDRLENVYY